MAGARSYPAVSIVSPALGEVDGLIAAPELKELELLVSLTRELS
jgi:hypothetical protein